MTGPFIVFVAAVAENGVIGRDNALPWKLPSDLRYFRAVTLGKPVIMGRKTFESIGKPLDGRDNIVVTRGTAFAAKGVDVARSLDEAFSIARGYAEQRGVDEICVIGGGKIYAAAMDRADRLYITRVHARPEGDARFPEIGAADWQEVRHEKAPRDERDSAATSYITYERRR